MHSYILHINSQNVRTMGNVSLQNGLDVLLLYDTSKSELTVSEIARNLGFTQSKTYRLVRTLTAANFLQKKGTKQYALGLNVSRLGLVAQQDLGLSDIAKPFMKELARLTRESVYLSILYGTKGMLIEKIESPEPIRYSHIKVGEMWPLTVGASGKVILAHRPREEWDQVIGKEGLRRYTPFTITDPHQFKKHLEEIVKKGYAFSDREQFAQVRAVAAPIRNRAGEVTAALAIIGPAYRMPKKRVREFADVAALFSEKISQRV
jgi:DNA-binding IclR family transcriptional regulator